MRFNCAYCGKQKTGAVFPNSSSSNQEKIMAGIMVCDNHEERAEKQLNGGKK